MLQSSYQFECSFNFSFIFSAVKKGVHDVYNIEFKPKFLIGDAADSIPRGFEKVFDHIFIRIMCWFHMRKNVIQRLPTLSSDKKQQAEFLHDIDQLQLSQNNEIFDKAAKLFMDKWMPVNETFMDYFEKTWLISHRYWYEGVDVHVPSTNNSVESTNRVIKDEHTFRERLDISRFRTVLYGMIEKWSLAYVNGLKEIHKRPNIELKIWTAAYVWAKRNVPMKVTETDSKKTFRIPSDPNNPDMIDRSCEWNSFNEFRKLNFACHDVTFPMPYTKDNWIEGTCTCSTFLKTFICEHVVGISLRMKFATAPDEAKSIPLGQKRKRGRPALAKAALILQ